MGLICKLMLDYVALSFVRTAQDVLDLREMMDSFGVQIPVIAKIEKWKRSPIWKPFGMLSMG